MTVELMQTMQTMQPEHRPEVRLAVIGARLDVSSAGEVRARLDEQLARGCGDLVIDLSGVEVIDATGLGVLLGADRRAKAMNRRLVLRAALPRVRRILRVTRLDRVLALEDAPLHS